MKVLIFTDHIDDAFNVPKLYGPIFTFGPTELFLHLSENDLYISVDVVLFVDSSLKPKMPDKIADGFSSPVFSHDFLHLERV